MKVPDRYLRFCTYLEKGRKITLSDEQTKLYLKAKEAVWIIKVDRGIIPNARQEIRKCDYLIYGETKETTHLVELKGAVIDEAYKQLNKTIDHIADVKEIAYLTSDRDILDAYIVSPNSQRIPKGVNSHERELAKRLASRCRVKPENILDLISYVKVVPKQARLVKQGRHIICSGQAPVEIE